MKSQQLLNSVWFAAFVVVRMIILTAFHMWICRNTDKTTADHQKQTNKKTFTKAQCLPQQPRFNLNLHPFCFSCHHLIMEILSLFPATWWMLYMLTYDGKFEELEWGHLVNKRPKPWMIATAVFLMVMMMVARLQRHHHQCERGNFICEIGTHN